MPSIDRTRQSAFADLSGDHSPLHVDPDHARRTQFGDCVVHGVHLVLLAIEALELGSPVRIVGLDAQFRSAVLVGEDFDIDVGPTSGDGSDRGRHELVVRSGTRVCATIEVRTAPVDTVGSVDPAGTFPTEVAEISGADDLVGLTGGDRLQLDTDRFGRLFPSLARTLTAGDAAALLGTTRIVGMRCPGRWALFRRLRWELEDGGTDEDDEAALGYEVVSQRPRFGMLDLEITAGPRRLRAETLVRDRPPVQVGPNEVRRLVDPAEFSGVRALIVGGSRGLGELAAYVLAAGAAEVMVTYRSGGRDARAVAERIGPASRVVRLDVEDPTPDALDELRDFAPTHLVYFATPTIAKRPANSWDHGTYDAFLRVYVTGLSRLLTELDPGGSLRGVFFPSSTFVTDSPAGFAEYVAAKLAGEELCRVWQRIRPDQHVLVERLPPLVTDQTAARMGSDTDGNLTTLLPVLRRAIEP